MTDISTIGPKEIMDLESSQSSYLVWPPFLVFKLIFQLEYVSIDQLVVGVMKVHRMQSWVQFGMAVILNYLLVENVTFLSWYEWKPK